MIKTVSLIMLSLLVIGGVFIGCSDQMTTTSNDQSQINGDRSLGKVDKLSFNDLILNIGPLYFDCGEETPNMVLEGQIKLIETLKFLPNGKVMYSSKTDYLADDINPLTLTNLDNGDVYHIVHGNNPYGFNESIDDIQEHWVYTEHYETDDGKKLIIHGNGYWHFINDGQVDVFRFAEFCK